MAIRNVVPLVGILAFRWSAGNVMILYLLDTVLSMAVIIAGLASNFAPPPDGEGAASWINVEAGYIVAEVAPDRFLRAMPRGSAGMTTSLIGLHPK